MTFELKCKDAGFDDCDAVIHTEDETELLELAKRHAKDVHGVDVDPDDVRGLVKTV